jgi:hypothetical protein
MLGRTFNSRLDPSREQHQGGGGVVGPQLPAVRSPGFHPGDNRVGFAWQNGKKCTILQEYGRQRGPGFQDVIFLAEVL